MSDSVRPHRWQSTRLPRPWDSPGKNTGPGCHFLLQSIKVKSESEVAQWCLTLSDPMDCSPPGSSIHGIFQARVLEWGAIAFSDMCLRIGINYLCNCIMEVSVQFSHSVMSNFLQPHRTVICQASLSITTSQSLLKLTSIELVMPFNHLILCCPLLLLHLSQH